MTNPEIHTESQMSRRTFIKTSAAAATAFTIIPRHVLGGTNYVAPSEMVNIAVIGCGGQGRTNMRQLLQLDDVRVISIADPNEDEDYSMYYYGGVAGRLPVKQEIEEHYQKTDPTFKCQDYVDYRVMFDKEKDIDAILCATPDHWHAFVTLAAINRGKHVYCEKPLTHCINECRVVAKAAKEAKLVTQMGNFGRSSESHRLMSEWLWDGAIGDVKEVHFWSTSTSFLKHRGMPPKGDHKVPEGFDWKLWLGPREYRPYHPEYAPFKWRWWWDFGTSTIGDTSIHHVDAAYSAIMPGHPTWIEGTSAWTNDITTPDNNRVEWFFEKTESRPEVRFIWYDGALKPPRPEELEEGRSMGDNGVLVVGEKGKILGGGWSTSVRIIPETKMKEYKQPPKTLRRSPGHHREWVDGIKGGPEPGSNFDYASKLSEFTLLGNVAVRAGKRINWDGEAMKVTNDSDANNYLYDKYSEGFDLT
jgi:predicted dehydrogenase